MKSNVRPGAPLTHERGPASAIALTPIQQLRRTLLTCLLFEETAYESGESIADRIKTLVSQCSVQDVCAIAIEARTVQHLRHVPLLLLREVLRKRNAGRIVGDTIAEVIQRPDELAELCALYWQDAKDSNGKRKMLPKQMRLGLARAFRKFSAYQLAKYDHNSADVKLRDVLFMVHGKPRTSSGTFATKHQRAKGENVGQFRPTEDERLYAQIVDRTLPTPETWEVKLSAGEDKKQTFEELMREHKLGDLALLRNIRNMEQAGISTEQIAGEIRERTFKNVLPFRFVAAYRVTSNVQIKEALDGALLRTVATLPPLVGSTVVLVDVSGSMDVHLSGKSDLRRLDAAAALACLVRGVAESGAVYCFSDVVYGIDGGNEGMQLVEKINQMSGGGTYLGAAINTIHKMEYDRLIVITDEQTADAIPEAKQVGREYIINCAPYKNGVGYDKGYVKIDGFSEAVITYIQAIEAQEE